MNKNPKNNVITAIFKRATRPFLHALLLGAALLVTIGTAHAKTAIAVEMDLTRPFGVEPWGIATGDGTRGELQDLAKKRCLARGGREGHIQVVFATNKILHGPCALVIGRTGNGGKVFQVASGKTTADAISKAYAAVKAAGATSWYTAKTFIAR